MSITPNDWNWCYNGNMEIIELTKSQFNKLMEYANQDGIPCDKRHKGFLCTRVINHTGDHVAGAVDQIACIWPNDEQL